MNKHTEGPWNCYPAPQYAEHWEDESQFFVVGPSEFHTVALIRHGNTDDGLPEQTEDNARLIAAAPDMLKALKPFAELQPGYTHGPLVSVWLRIADIEAAKAAIARAQEGGEG